jgi:hypothetical protein
MLRLRNVPADDFTSHNARGEHPRGVESDLRKNHGELMKA